MGEASGVENEPRSRRGRQERKRSSAEDDGGGSVTDEGDVEEASGAIYVDSAFAFVISLACP